VNPANSLLNYTNAVAESECRLAACACGLDPGLGFLHTDTANRDSLALDLIETIRPAIEAWILDWLMREPLRRSDFVEAANGNCRLSSGLCSKLSDTAPIWGKLVAHWAEYVAHTLRASHTYPPRAARGFSTHSRRLTGGKQRVLRRGGEDANCRAHLPWLWNSNPSGSELSEMRARDIEEQTNRACKGGTRRGAASRRSEETF
jgi:CRISPR associated protein, Cas1 family